MKIRLGYVGNSSSSSFIICKEFLSPSLINKIKDHKNSEEYKKEFGDDWLDAWDITMDSDKLYGYTMMDNFDMENYLVNVLDIDHSHIEWKD